MEYELKKTQLTFAETLRIVEDAVSACFETDSEGNDTDFRPECKDVSLQLAFCENYLEIEFGEDFDENFTKYMSINIDNYRGTTEFNAVQWYSIRHAVEDKIEYRKQLLLDSKTSQSKMYSSISSLIDTLNSKAEQLDIKKIEKVIKKLNVTEIIKAYQKSGMGESVSDKAITEQSATIKEKDKIIADLKNQISSRNVKA